MHVSEIINISQGYIEFHQVADFADIHHIEIKASFRNQGYGKVLMSLFLKEMEKRGVIDVTLEVRVDNFVAIKLYEACGFLKTSVRKGYYDGVDGHLMCKKIDS